MRVLSFILLALLGSASAHAASMRLECLQAAFTIDEEELNAEKVVVRANSGSYVSFDRTDRDLHFMKLYNIYPKEALSREHLLHKTILDIATGDGAFVYDLRKQGFNAFGTDIYLKDAQKKESFFYEADSQKLPFADASVDNIFSAYSIFSEYYGPEFDEAFLQRCLEEINRVLRPGGTAYLSYPDPRLQEIAQRISGWQVSFRSFERVLVLERKP